MTATIMGMLYGKPKRMKTSMVASAFPGALWVPGEGPNAITSVAENEWGFTPTIYDPEESEYKVRTLDDLIDLLHSMEEQDSVKHYSAVCVDGTTAICEASLRYWTDNPKITDKGKVDKFWPYQQLKDKLLRLSETARHIGVHVFLVAHEQEPSTTQEGDSIPGGPSLGSKKQVVRVPAWCDFNGRAVINSGYPGSRLGMKAGIYVDPWDPDWVTGDRNGVACNGVMPPNLREILRASRVDYNLARLPGLEWQDEVADITADAFMNLDNIDEVIDAGINAGQKHAKGQGRQTLLHIRWAVQDGIARGVIQKRRQNDVFARLDPPDIKGTKAPKAPPPPPSSDED